MLRYAITSGTADSRPGQSGPGMPVREHVRYLIGMGAEFLQLREKHLSAAELTGLAREILAMLRAADSPLRLLINGRADVAVAAGAHGVHLTSAPDGLTPDQVRRLYQSIGLPRPIVSKACRTRVEVMEARRLQPDLILFSPVFGKTIHFIEGRHELPATGLGELAMACALADPIPVLALGGVTAGNTDSCLAAGARGVAGIRLFQPLMRV